MDPHRGAPVREPGDRGAARDRDARRDRGRARVAKKLASAADKTDQDLRDTAVTWLARAGCSLPQIASITGHSLQSIHQVLKHYLAITPELADEAIQKLVEWMEKNNMRVG